MSHGHMLTISSRSTIKTPNKQDFYPHLQPGVFFVWWYNLYMQSNKDNQTQWLLSRGITPDVLSLFNVSTQHTHPTIGACIRIPYTSEHSKYRRDPSDARKPKYLYDTGGKVTLYGFDKLSDTTVVVTEGELDTLVLWSKNIQAVSSTGGAMSWQDEWSEDLKNAKKVYLCFDNDDTGVRGMVKVLKSLPNASVILIPEIPDVKDVSDYVSRGGDFIQLMESALSDITPTSIEADMGRRKGMMLSTRFHQAYLDSYHQDLHKDTYTPSTYTGDDAVLRARSYPMTELISFTKRTVCCPWHNEKTPSLHYYPKTNTSFCFGGCSKSYDSIDAYRVVHGVGFVEAVKGLNKLI